MPATRKCERIVENFNVFHVHKFVMQKEFMHTVFLELFSEKRLTRLSCEATNNITFKLGTLYSYTGALNFAHFPCNLSDITVGRCRCEI